MRGFFGGWVITPDVFIWGYVNIYKCIQTIIYAIIIIMFSFWALMYMRGIIIFMRVLDFMSTNRRSGRNYIGGKSPGNGIANVCQN